VNITLTKTQKATTALGKPRTGPPRNAKGQPVDKNRAFAGTLGEITQFIQDQKILLSSKNIVEAKGKRKWPEGDDYLSWVGKETNRNLFKDPKKFFRFMHERPQLFNKRFIFRPIGSQGQRIREATIAAMKISRRQTQKYIAAPNVSGSPNITTGAYLKQFKLSVNNKLLTDPSQLDNLASTDIVRYYNTAVYAGRAETIALYYAQTIGILYYTAQVIKKKYPELSIRFHYVKAEFVPGATSFENIPMIVIGARGRVEPRITKPGKAHRRRDRIRRSRL
jgi:hypothetical protein